MKTVGKYVACAFSYKFHVKYSVDNTWEGLKKRSLLYGVNLPNQYRSRLIDWKIMLCCHCINHTIHGIKTRGVTDCGICRLSVRNNQNQDALRWHLSCGIRCYFTALIYVHCNVVHKSNAQKYINVIWLHIDNNRTELRVMLCRYCINGANL